MKITKLYGICTVGLLLLTSCLGDGGTGMTLGSQAGVVTFVPEQVICLNSGDLISSPEFQKQSVNEGECCLIDYSVNFSSLQNGSGDKGYYVGEISNYTVVNNWPVASTLTDTAVVFENEKTIAAINQRNAYILGQFFLYSEHRIDSTKFTASFNLSYDPKLPITIDDKGQRVYSVFLRVLMKQSGAPASGSDRLLIPNAFAFKEFVEKAGAIEKQQGNESLYFRVNYAKAFDRDTTKIAWGSSDVFTLSIPTQDN